MPKSVMFIAWILTLASLIGCASNGKKSDPFQRGLEAYQSGDTKGAEESWRPLADRGDCDAQARFGLLLLTKEAAPGPNAERLRSEAINYLRRAAAQGHPKALSILGDLSNHSRFTFLACEGCKVKKSNVMALKNYTLAEKFASNESEREYSSRMKNSLADSISADEKKQATELVTKWRPAPRQCSPRRPF